MSLLNATWKHDLGKEDMSLDPFLYANRVLYYCGIQMFLDYPHADGDMCFIVSWLVVQQSLCTV